MGILSLEIKEVGGTSEEVSVISESSYGRGQQHTTDQKWDQWATGTGPPKEEKPAIIMPVLSDTNFNFPKA